MSTFIALLHSIVLTPDRRVIMQDLRALAEELGYREPRTLVSTGNLVFEADEMRPHELETQLEEAFEEKFGRHVDIIVRSDCTWMALCSTNPFKDGNGDQVIVRVMRLPVDPTKVEALKQLMTAGGQGITAVCPVKPVSGAQAFHARCEEASTTVRSPGRSGRFQGGIGVD